MRERMTVRRAYAARYVLEATIKSGIPAGDVWNVLASEG